MEYGNNKLIITEDSIRELVGFVMDVQDELTKSQLRLEMLEKYYRNKPHFLTEEVKLILGIDESKSAGEESLKARKSSQRPQHLRRFKEARE